VLSNGSEFSEAFAADITNVVGWIMRNHVSSKLPLAGVVFAAKLADGVPLVMVDFAVSPGK
jgi:hypothetical protein